MRANARWMHVSDEKGGVGGGQTRVFSRFSGHIPVCSQTYHGPQTRAVSHRAAAGKRKASLSAWEKWERRKERKEKKKKRGQESDKSVKLQGQVPPDVEQLQRRWEEGSLPVS